jgi:hypothetical protein
MDVLNMPYVRRHLSLYLDWARNVPQAHPQVRADCGRAVYILYRPGTDACCVQIIQSMFCADHVHVLFLCIPLTCTSVLGEHTRLACEAQPEGRCKRLPLCLLAGVAGQPG